jgi:hypothetical protein
MDTAHKLNRVPAAPIVEIVREYLAQQEDLMQVDDEVGMSPIGMLALRCDLREDTLYKIVVLERAETLDFDLADLLLAKMNRVDCWRGILHDIYYSTPLVDGMKQIKPGRASAKQVCERPGCSNEFITRPRGRKRKWCSKSCAQAMSSKRRREKDGHRVRTMVERLYHSCPRGHERSEENSRRNPKTGKLNCLACKREKAREKYYADAEHRRKKIEQSRAYRQERPAA